MIQEKTCELPRWRSALFAAAATVLAACGQESNVGFSSSTPSQPNATMEKPQEPLIVRPYAGEAPAVSTERIIKPGDTVATIRIPRLCNMVLTVLAIGRDEVEDERIGKSSDYKSGYRTGGSHIDQLIPEVAPQQDCIETKQAAEQARRAEQAQGKLPYYATRGERRVFFDKNKNHRQDAGEEYLGQSNAFVPLGGLWPGTGAIGQKGNPVIFAHRTIENAAAASLDVLKPGDELFVTSVGQDTATYTYKVTQQEIVDQTELGRVLHPPGHDTRSMLTIFACTPQGQAEQRIVIRAERSGPAQ